MAHGIDTLMKAVEAAHPLPPLDRIVAEATAGELVNIQDAFEPGGRLRHQKIAPREV
jgi:hypothetical protein